MAKEILDLSQYDAELISALLGNNDDNLKMIGEFYGCSLAFENGVLSFTVPTNISFSRARVSIT